MAELTQLETKLAEVMGLAQAATDSTENVAPRSGRAIRIGHAR